MLDVPSPPKACPGWTLVAPRGRAYFSGRVRVRRGSRILRQGKQEQSQNGYDSTGAEESHDEDGRAKSMHPPAGRKPPREAAQSNGPNHEETRRVQRCHLVAALGRSLKRQVEKPHTGDRSDHCAASAGDNRHPLGRARTAHLKMLDPVVAAWVSRRMAGPRGRVTPARSCRDPRAVRPMSGHRSDGIGCLTAITKVPTWPGDSVVQRSTNRAVCQTWATFIPRERAGSRGPSFTHPRRPLGRRRVTSR